MLLQACLNGARRSEEHPALPRTPAELARDAAAVVEVGARSVHLHARDRAGEESLAAEDVAAAVLAVRAAAPGVEISVSTGLWIAEGDPQRRAALVAAWGHPLPDAASVNVAEEGWSELAALLAGLGVRVEAGVASVADAAALATADLGRACARVLVEPPQPDAEAALTAAEAMEETLDAAAVELPRLHHGEGPATWRVLDAALAKGRDVRIGLEDVLVLPDGRPAGGNADLVAALAARLRA